MVQSITLSVLEKIDTLFTIRTALKFFICCVIVASILNYNRKPCTDLTSALIALSRKNKLMQLLQNKWKSNMLSSGQIIHQITENESLVPVLFEDKPFEIEIQDLLGIKGVEKKQFFLPKKNQCLSSKQLRLYTNNAAENDLICVKRNCLPTNIFGIYLEKLKMVEAVLLITTIGDVKKNPQLHWIHLYNLDTKEPLCNSEEEFNSKFKYEECGILLFAEVDNTKKT